jgi:hypothetical protein
MTVDFKFAIGESVFIEPLKLYGTILAACHRGFMPGVKYSPYNEYRVIYWAESKRYDEWLLEGELEK